MRAGPLFSFNYNYLRHILVGRYYARGGPGHPCFSQRMLPNPKGLRNIQHTVHLTPSSQAAPLLTSGPREHRAHFID
jgi:hypothetical protein